MSYIVADNGANMQCAIKKIHAEDQPSEDSEDEDEDEEEDEEEDAGAKKKKTQAEGEVEDKFPELLPPLEETDIEHLVQREEEIFNSVTCMGKQSGKCFSHTMQLAVGKALNGNVSLFRNPLKKARELAKLFGRSGKAKDILKARGGVTIKSYSATRWFSELNTVKSLLQNRQKKGDPVSVVAAEMGWKNKLPTAEVS